VVSLPAVPRWRLCKGNAFCHMKAGVSRGAPVVTDPAQRIPSALFRVLCLHGTGASANLPAMPARSVLVLLCLLVALSCARNPVSGRPEVVLVSARQEREIGAAESKKVEALMGLVDQAALQAYVQAIGGRLARHSPRQDVDYSFQVVDAMEPNAFALPGGFIYVSRGLLALVNEEDELAGVLGHEIGHVAARHHVRSVTVATPFAIVVGIPAAIVGVVSETLGNVVAAPGSLVGGLVLARHSRGQERQADRVGMELVAKAGWDPGALARFLETLEREDVLRRGSARETDFFDTHPSTPERVQEVAKRAESMQSAPADPIAGDRAALLARLEGLLVGPNPADGLFVEEQFLHPVLDLAIRFPPHWETENQPRFVAAVEPEGKGATFVLLQVSARGEDPMDGVRADELDDRLVATLERMEINGLPAARLVTEKRGSAFELTWIAHHGRVFRISAVSPSSDFPRHRDALRKVAESFRSLRAEELAGIEESRLAIERARAGEALSELLRRAGGDWSPEETAVANALETEVVLEAGQLLKVSIPRPYAQRF
jgi:predicted Zn-dependent protease